MRNKALIIATLFLLAIFYYLFTSNNNSNTHGLTKEKAFAIATDRLSTKFNKNDYSKQFVVVSEQLEQDKSWYFCYKLNDCIIYISIDSRGVADISGISKECDSLLK